jgi:hypothetical protein
MEIELSNCTIEINSIIGDIFKRYDIFKSLKEGVLNEDN